MAEILTREDLWLRIRGEPPLVEGLLDPQLQIQVEGIELTVRQIETFAEAGVLGATDGERQLPQTVPLDFSPQGWLYLAQGCYKVLYNEIVHIPTDMVALARPRSSLLRMGVTIETALWDSGYSGRSESLLIVANEKGFRLKRDARLIQLIFFQLNKPVSQGYAGRYQRENLDEQSTARAGDRAHPP